MRISDWSSDVCSSDLNRKEIAARLFAEPFNNSPGFFQGLGFGVGGSYGDKDGTGDSGSVNYRTPGQTTPLTYLAGTAYDGSETRLSQQAYLHPSSLRLPTAYLVARGTYEPGQHAGKSVREGK